MHWSKLPLTDQIFTHLDPQTKAETTFAATRLREHCNLWKAQVCTLTLTPITADGASLMRERRGLEAHRLRRAHKTRRYEPLLYTHMLDGTHLLIDGSHTYFAMHAKGIKEAKSYIVEPHVWKDFTVTGLPEVENEHALLTSYSGITL